MSTRATETEDDSELLLATFLLGEDGIFAIDAILIQEVIMVGELTPVRHAPEYVAGIRNLRGRIITVIDLSLRLGLGSVALTPESRILITDWKGEPVGMLVDQVTEAILVPIDQLEAAPPNLHGVQMQRMLGVFRYGERLGALLDLDALLDPEEGATTALSGDEMKGRL